MNSRYGLILVVAALPLAGCGDSFNAGPLKYVESARGAAVLKEKPKVREAVQQDLAGLFGEDPQSIRVPAGSGLPYGGMRLAGYFRFPDKGDRRFKLPATSDPGKAPSPELVRGGYTLYREHCLHCHGVSGAGDGPTAPFLFPRPRDYRKGIFKFTSTANGQKPTRADLEKTIRYGLHGTSMPAFESLMTEFEIDQAVDYVIFLSMRGETEDQAVDAGDQADENDLNALKEEIEGIGKAVFNKWKQANSYVLNPPAPRPDPSPESIRRGRDLFLQRDKTTHKLECMGCHGPLAQGNGPSFVLQEIFNDVVFGGDPDTRGERLQAWSKKYPDVATKWKESLDEWGDPLRPANLNRGVYKGGRRPIDIYWRIAKGINGAKMPAHESTLKPEEIWDVVNFVLQLPYEPELLTKAGPIPPPAPAKKVANR